ncbi:MAG: DoxX family protein [Acidobacteriota bacterium]|nr:DoxX family protein [Acidobacteriota bacterium]
MIPLIILITTFVVFYLLNTYAFDGRFTMSFAGRFALAALLLAAGIAHFTSIEPMVAMMPETIPYKRELVYFTGICELLAVFGLLWDKTARLTGGMLILFFVAVLPANIAGALNSVPFGGMVDGPSYLFFRIPMQLLFIAWAWVFAVISVGTGSAGPLETGSKDN